MTKRLVVALLAVVAIAAATFWLVRHRKGVEVPVEAEGPAVPMSQAILFRIATAPNHLWLTTSYGVVEIDPVAQRWTMLDKDARNVGASPLLPCNGRLWVEESDTVLLFDPNTRAFQARWGRKSSSENRGEDQGEDEGEHEHAFPIITRCGTDGIWVFDGHNPSFVPDTGTTTKVFPPVPIPDGGDVDDLTEALHRVILTVHSGYGRLKTSLLTLDPQTSQYGQLENPAGIWVGSTTRAEDGALVVRSGHGGRTFVMRQEGQWVEAPSDTLRQTEGTVAQGKGVVWVGASYDVSPGSYFVLRYIRDAMEPKDLVLLARSPRDWVYGGLAVEYLGMLWIPQERRLLRIDASARELMSYQLSDSGTLTGRAFPLVEGQLRIFAEDSLVDPHPPVPPAPPGSEPQ